MVLETVLTMEERVSEDTSEVTELDMLIDVTVPVFEGGTVGIVVTGITVGETVGCPVISTKIIAYTPRHS